MATAQPYPVRVDASLDSPLSRWLWIVKWVLVIPHYVVLAFLWIAFVVLSVVAFFAILFTGRYPRAIFEFNVGVLRWTWRVQYYAIGAFGTDRYPPFTLADVPGYPAHLEIEYPGRLSRGLVLVKWWLLAIPHYIIVGLFTGGGVWLAWRYGSYDSSWGGFGLIGFLVLIAAIILLFTGRYPQQIFDFVLGMNRWVLRVAAYASLMTDDYPPFRLDMGGNDPGGTLAVPPSPPPGQAFPPAGQADPPPGTSFTQGGQAYPPGGQSLAQRRQVPMAHELAGGPPGAGTGGQPPGLAPRPTGWTAPRIISVVIGSVLVLISLGLFSSGGAALWAETQRDSAGYVDVGTATYSTAGYALASEPISVQTASNGWDAAKPLFGTVRIRVTPTAGTSSAFAGIAAASAADAYLAGVQYATVQGPADGHTTYIQHSGTAPKTPPGSAGFWAAKASGTGTQTLVWPVRSGDWTLVAMNADGGRPVSVRVNAAATLPWLPWVATGLLIGGAVFLAGGIILIVVPVRNASYPPLR